MGNSSCVPLWASPRGRLVFEVRDPAKEAWKGWNREQSYQTIEAPGIGTVESWVELVNVQLPPVSFRYIFMFREESPTGLCGITRVNLLTNVLIDAIILIDDR
jgi:hypothetical protein